MKRHVRYRQVKQFFLLFLVIVVAFTIFLGVMLGNVLTPKHMPKLYVERTAKAIRGAVVTADGFHVAKSQKLYKAVVNTKYIDPDKKELFIALFSIYSDIPASSIRKKLAARNANVVLSYNIPQKEANYLKRLAYELRRYRVFVPIKNKKTGFTTLQGLSVIESGEKREYPYQSALTPLIGYPHKVERNGYTTVVGVKGIEKRFDKELSPVSDGKIYGKRDVNGYIVLNKESFIREPKNGLDIRLGIDLGAQIRIERLLDKAKRSLGAYEIYAAVMETKTGKVVAAASSNRYLPKHIRKKDYDALNASLIEYSFEPGSVIKPLTFAVLLEHKRINPYEIVNGHNGRFRIGRKIITDEHRFAWLSAEDVIVYSSNVGIAQLAQRLSGREFYQGLQNFALARRSTPDLIYEKVGSLPSALRLNHAIYKATTAYGYGLRVNLLQLIRAYAVFSNGGFLVTPYFVEAFIDQEGNEIKIEHEAPRRVLSATTAKRIQKILVKTVQKGTGKKAITPGLVVGGKTGTAHMVENGRYVNKYTTSFVGFANDENHRYTIGVVVRRPSVNHFAAQTAVPVFKQIVDVLIEEEMLQPNIIK